jgi:hypothetical protein
MARKRSGASDDWRRPPSDSVARFREQWQAEAKLLDRLAKEFGDLAEDDFRREVLAIGIRKMLNSRQWSAQRLGIDLDVPASVAKFANWKK